MKRKTFKYKGFTLLEVIVAMALTGAIVALSARMLHNFEKQFNLFKKHQIRQIEQYVFWEVLLNDMHKSKVLSKNDSLFEFCFENQVVTYDFNGKKVLRKSSVHTDTLDVEVKQATAYFNGSMLNMNGVVDKIELHIKQDNLERKWVLEKKYPADILLEIENGAKLGY